MFILVINITEKREESTKKQRTQQPQNKRIKTTNKVPEKIKQEEENISSKLRPYLAVVCTNLRGISNVEKKIGELAEAIGKTKVFFKCLITFNLLKLNSGPFKKISSDQVRTRLILFSKSHLTTKTLMNRTCQI